MILCESQVGGDWTGVVERASPSRANLGDSDSGGWKEVESGLGQNSPRASLSIPR